MRLCGILTAAAAAVALTGCGSSSSTATRSTPTSSAAQTKTSAPAPAGVTPGQKLATGFRLTSPAFRPGGLIPKLYACEGRDLSLPLRWSGVPQGTRELVLVMRDPDAPSGNFVHWALAGIAPATAALPAGGVAGQVVPGRNSFGALGYRGPCPPPGDHPHHYVITLSALAGASGLHPGFAPDQLRTSALGIATLIGVYARR